MLLLNILGFVQSLFLGSLLLLNPAKEEVQRIGGLLMIVFAIPIFNSIRILHWGPEFINWFDIVSNHSLLFIGPFLYLYSRERVNKNGLSAKDKIHFIPGLFLFLLSIFFQCIQGQLPLLIEVFGAIFLICSLAAYLFFSCKMIYAKDVEKSVKYAIYGFTLIWHINLVIQIGDIFTSIENQNILIGSTLLLSVLVIILNYTHWIELIKLINRPKTKLTLTAAKTKTVLQKIESELALNKPYLSKDFSLQKLSSLIDEPSSYISHVINKQLGIKFTKYIAQCRIKEFIQKHNEGEFEGLTIQAMAEEVGFGSPATFNKSFKESLKMLPSEYLKAKQRH